MKKKLTASIIIFLFIVVGCSTFETVNEQEIATDGLVYKTVYSKDDFKIREAYLGTWESMDWDNFPMPTARIEDTSQNLGLDDYIDEEYLDWKEELDTTGWCTDTVKIMTSDGTESEFSITKDHIGLGGHYLLRKNGNLIWEGDFSAPIEGPILSSKQIGDEIAVDYFTITASEEKRVDSIMITTDSGTVDVVETTSYDAAFAPNELLGKLAYFGKIHPPDVKVILVFDDTELADYDSVFNQYCCWGGPPIQVATNGEVLDFFAERDGNWYHVQAGHLPPHNQ